jgi:hypothetical protein
MTANPVPTPFRAAFIARAMAAHRRIALESAEKARRACVVPPAGPQRSSKA